MKAIYIRVPDEAHVEMKVALARRGKTMQEVLGPIVLKWVGKGCPDKKEES